jgi:glucose uptake protein GlcU
VASAVILGIVAIAFLTVGIIFSVEPAGSLPSWLGHETIVVGRQTMPSPSYHPLRAVGSLIAGVVFAIGALFSLKYKGQETAPSH